MQMTRNNSPTQKKSGQIMSGCSHTWLDLGIFILLLAIIVICFNIMIYYSYHREPGMNWAKGTLRSFGSSELAYADANSNRVYGSFEALQKTNDIAPDYTLDNMIEDYKIIFYINPSVKSPSDFENNMGAFTIITIPTVKKRGLHTYCITEDQVVREFHPDSGYSFDQYQRWDPII
jgi:hypothetical protein